MSETIIVALIVAVLPTLASVLAVLASLRNANKIQDVHLAINSRFDEWLRMAKEAAFIAGHLAAKEERAAQDTKPPSSPNAPSTP